MEKAWRYADTVTAGSDYCFIWYSLTFTSQPFFWNKDDSLRATQKSVCPRLQMNSGPCADTLRTISWEPQTLPQCKFHRKSHAFGQKELKSSL